MHRQATTRRSDVASGATSRARRDRARNDRAVSLLISVRSAPESERRRAQQRVVLDYLDVAHAVAGRYRVPREEPSDLRQVAYIGLTNAVQRFEPTRGGDIVSFAVPTIAGEIKRYLRDSTWFVRPPRHLQDLHAALRVTERELAQRLGRDPLPAELAEAMGEPVGRVLEALRCAHWRDPASLDAPHRSTVDSGEAGTLADTLHAGTGEFENAELAATLADACRVLSDRERRIVHLRFFEERTQAEIARECGVTQVQISRVLMKILATLRDRLEATAGRTRAHA